MGKGNRTGKTLCKIIIAAATVLVLLFAVSMVYSKRQEIKAAFARIRDAFLYTCDDFSDDENADDIFCNDSDNY